MERVEKKRRAGFSMTELLVVVAAILILVSLLFVVGGRMYGQSRLLQCQHHLEQIGRAMNMYATGHQGMLPPLRSLGGRPWYQTLAATHLDDGRVLGCPLIGPPPYIRVAEVNPPPSENIERFDMALYWLRDHQITDGANAGQIRTSSGDNQMHNVKTAWTLKALLGAGCNDRHPPEFTGTVRMAVEWLTGGAQWEDGRFKGGLSHYQYENKLVASTAICVMALAAAYQEFEDATLRTRARQSAERALQFLSGITDDHGGYGYSGPCDYDPSGWGGRSRMSNAIFLYMGVGMAKRAGFNVPSHLDNAVNRVLQLNRHAGGVMRWRWNPNVDTASGDGSYMCRYGWALAIQLAHGTSQAESHVRYQINQLKQTSGGVPRHMEDIINTNFRLRYYYFPASRSLRMLGGDMWDEWRNPTPEYGWQGLPHYIAQHMANAGYDDEGNAMGYWPASASVLGPGRGATSSPGTWGQTGFSAMMFSDVFEDSWLDEDYVRPVDIKSSYGYNQALGQSRATVPADTIMVMDYDNWVIRRGSDNPEETDDDTRIALRHLGRANALMGDGSVRSLYLEEITPRGRWTLDRGD